ncbi:MAG TPA: 5-formyltetrahydrofolate cyclo-ligase [Chlamydiales bacterium]|nr:5-formyltetrahydrofolate cyclo-ligase [Chlamydiales bacterium]
MQPAFLKNNLRKEYLKIRETLSQKRRKEASLKAMELLTQDLPILSFASFKNEIDLWPLNHELAKRRQLLLPKMTKEGLTIYWVDDIQKLIPTNNGLLEPDPNNSLIFSSEKQLLALIPGVAFDQKKHRLGFGKGYYDRFLKSAPYVTKWGVGFKEQLSLDLPIEDHDVRMDKLLLF